MKAFVASTASDRATEHEVCALNRSAGRVRIGTSGWVYEHWRGRFYPRSLTQTRWLDFYAAHFDSVELNSPFYRQPTLAQFERWRGAVPRGFAFAVKLNRFV